MFFETYDDDEEESYAGYERAEDPKTLGDVFESVAGAIFLDSDFSLDAVWRVYYNLMKNQIGILQLSVAPSLNPFLLTSVEKRFFFRVLRRKMSEKSHSGIVRS
jgi:hypothetical protein